MLLDGNKFLSIKILLCVTDRHSNSSLVKGFNFALEVEFFNSRVFYVVNSYGRKLCYML